MSRGQVLCVGVRIMPRRQVYARSKIMSMRQGYSGMPGRVRVMTYEGTAVRLGESGLWRQVYAQSKIMSMRQGYSGMLGRVRVMRVQRYAGESQGYEGTAVRLGEWGYGHRVLHTSRNFVCVQS
jgi:hypothetical protein